jgi:hypothetical protein
MNRFSVPSLPSLLFFYILNVLVRPAQALTLIGHLKRYLLLHNLPPISDAAFWLPELFCKSCFRPQTNFLWASTAISSWPTQSMRSLSWQRQNATTLFWQNTNTLIDLFNQDIYIFIYDTKVRVLWQAATVVYHDAIHFTVPYVNCSNMSLLIILCSQPQTVRDVIKH